MKDSKKENRIISMNDDLYDSMFLEELEVRLETDPLVPGGLLNLVDGVASADCGVDCDCNGVHIECSPYCDVRCGCNGVNINY